MSTIKSDSEDLTLNAHGSGNDIIFQSNASQVGSLTAEGVMTSTTFAGSGASLTALPAAQLTGTIADARFPATLPAASAANLTAIPAANITGTLPAISGANLTGVGVTGITSSANSNAMTIDSSENITISNSNNADTVLTIDSQTANGNVGILKIAGDVAGGGFGAGYQSAKINFFQSAEHICTISSKRSEGDEGELSFQTRDTSDSAPVERMRITKDGRGLSQFTAKAWVNFNQSAAIRDSHNVSSATDNGTGDYTVNWDVDLANANYSFALGAEAKGSAADDVISVNKTTAGASASSISVWTVRVVHGTSYNADYDTATVCVQVFGD